MGNIRAKYIGVCYSTLLLGFNGIDLSLAQKTSTANTKTPLELDASETIPSTTSTSKGTGKKEIISASRDEINLFSSSEQEQVHIPEGSSSQDIEEYYKSLPERTFSKSAYSTFPCLGTCLGGSNTGCWTGRELYRGQFLCSTLTGFTNIQTRVGIDLTGNFVYQEWSTTGNTDEPSREIMIHSGFGEYLRMRTGGNLVLRDANDRTIWETNTDTGYQFVLNSDSFYLFDEIGNILFFGPLDNDLEFAGCVGGDCLGGSSTGCLAGRELYRGEFICYTDPDNGNLYQLGLSPEGLFMFKETIGNNDPLDTVILDSLVARKLRLRSGGSLELQDFNGDALWKIGSDLGHKLVVDGLGYQLLSRYGSVLWEGTQYNVFGDPAVGCVPGDCIGAPDNGCLQGRELFRNQFLCHVEFSNNQPTGLTKVGISSTGELIYERYSRFGNNVNLNEEVKIRSFAFAEKLRMRSGGNLVLRDYGGKTIWETGTHDGARFVVGLGEIYVETDYGLRVWEGLTDQTFTDRGCVPGNCLGGSGSLCPQGRELFKGQYICHQLETSNTIVTQVGLSLAGKFEYNEFLLVNGNLLNDFPVVIASSQQAQRLRVTSSGSLELLDVGGNVLWRVYSGAGFKFLIDEEGYRFVSRYNQVIWNGPINNNQITPFKRSQECVVGNCLGAPSIGCPQGRDLNKGEFLCHELTSSNSTTTVVAKIGIDNEGKLVYREYKNNIFNSVGKSPTNELRKEVTLSSKGGGQKLRLQTDGNLVLRDSNSNEVWTAGVDHGSKFVLDETGYYVEGQNGYILWDGELTIDEENLIKDILNSNEDEPSNILESLKDYISELIGDFGEKLHNR